MRSPQFDASFEDLPLDPKERHEALVDLFGDYMFWVREQAVLRIRQLVETEGERNKLGTLFQGVFEDAARLSNEDRATALKLAESAVNNFAGLFLAMLSGQGFDDPIGPNHVFRYRLNMEICDADTGQIVYEEVINRGGRKFFPEYWGRWLNRYHQKLRITDPQADRDGHSATG